MKLNFILFLILYLIIEIKCKKHKKEDKIKEEEESKEELNDEEEEGGGSIMSDEIFEEKVQKFLEEKNLKKKKKITKDILKQIFDAIYKKEFDLPEIPDDNKVDIDLDPKVETERFMGEIFYKLTRSLDYDDKISIKDIKEYISPNKVRIAVNEIVENLIGMAGKSDL